MGWDGTKSMWDGSSRSRPGSMPGPGWDKVLVGWELPSRSHGQPIFLAKNLSNSVQDYTLYLDNLFINGLLAKTLRQLDIEVMSTTQVKALELSLTIRQLKQAKESLK